MGANAWLLYLSVVMTLVTMCAMACCENMTRRFPTNYLLLFVFTAFEGVCVGFISTQYTWQSVVLAMGMTTVIFLCMTVFAWKSSTDFTGFGPYLRSVGGADGLWSLHQHPFAVWGPCVLGLHG